MKTHALRLGGLLLGATLALTACAGAPVEDESAPEAEETTEETTGSETPDELTAITVSLLPITHTSPVHIAVQEGIFEEEGLEVTIEYGSTGAAIVPSVLNGSIQIGYANINSTIQGRSEGLPLVSIATSDGAAQDPDLDTNVLLVSADSDIQSPADLNGKTIAVNALSGLIYVTTRKAADNLGADSSTFEMVEIPFPEMLGALESGQVDAVSVTEPFYTIGMASGAREILTVINLGGERPGFVTDTYFTTEEYLEENAEVVDAFRRAIYRANALANSNPDLVREVVATYTPIPPEIIEQMRLPYWPDEPISEEDVDLMISLMQDYDILSGPAPTYEELIRE